MERKETMTRTRILTVLVSLTLASAVATSAADFEGVLMDQMCSAKALQEGGQRAAAMHKRSCALMPDCVKSGYGVVTADGKFLALDENGSKRAQSALKASKKTDDIRVRVTGEQSGDTMQVKSLKIL
jgi:hypothetical protein